MVDSASYREKYFHALKEQERIEKQLTLQCDLLRKTMLQLAGAASGMDQSLDATVLRMRELMRGGSGAQVVEQMDRVQAAIMAFERNRSQENTKAAKAMSLLIEQYIALQIPADLKASLKSFGQSLTKRLGNFRQYPAALEDLAKLQQLALDMASNPQASFWQRLKGGITLKPVNEDIQPQQDQQKVTEEGGNDNGELVQTFIGLSEDGEEDYEKVASRIASTLSNLVERIEPNDVIKHRVDIVRHRIDRGMDWYVLAVTLEDIRDILFLRYLQADEEFSDYLNQVRSELGTIREALAGISDQGEEHAQAANTFSDRVSSGVDLIRNSVESTTQIDVLKDEVTEHISFIADALKTFRSEPGSSITDQLEKLVAQVKSIEQESQQTKDALEEQRYKATHDKLTGLPNREAYGERVFHEFERFKRYERPLAMAVCDIDYFKKINDGYGHQAGDKVLKLIGKVISTRLRNVDFIARYGGEEFVILMPETEAEQALSVLDKIRAAVAKTPFRFKENPVNITISFGVASFGAEDSAESTFERADKALYEAKEKGRNRCVLAP